MCRITLDQPAILFRGIHWYVAPRILPTDLTSLLGDYHTVVEYIHSRYPQSPLFGVGFSLGASVLARYMGEQGEGCLLTAGCVMGCPWNIPAMSHT